MSKVDNFIQELIKETKYIFHKHDYQIAITSGINSVFNRSFLTAAKDVTEIKCYCSKCGKVFKTYTI
jgi:hypothetical protein